MSEMDSLKVISMQGGDGDESYSQNSGLQNFSLNAYGKAHLGKAVRLYKQYNTGILWNNIRSCTQDEADLTQLDANLSRRLIQFADYGCSYGRNTVEYAHFLIRKFLDRLDGEAKRDLEQESKSQPNTPLDQLIFEFQYFFVDLPSNDFNSLFHMLSSSYSATDGLKFYAAGVPGSFYERVLPKGSVDFALTTYSLHWLSQVPPVLLDKNTPAWNGGHVWIPTHGGGAVSEAYAEQFQVDARRFLRCRAEEMRSNGILFIFSLCRACETTPAADYAPRYDSWSGYFEQTWKELVEEGIIEASEMDSFNVPQYNFSKREFAEALQSIVELELLELHVLANCDCLPRRQIDALLADPASFGEFWTSFLRSLIQPLVDAHIGKTRASQFFDRLQIIATKDTRFTRNLASDFLIAIIRRK